MRWVGSMVADVYRILMRGGVYLYPEDSREGYEHGRLRLLYEANPIAFLIEQAGGAAIDGFRRILDDRAEGRRTSARRSSSARRTRSSASRATTRRRPVRRCSRPLFGKRGLLRR